MSRENVEVARLAIETFLSGDVDGAIDRYFALDGEFVSRFGALEGGRYEGDAGARRYFADISEAWKSYERELVDVIDAGPAAVAVVNITAVARSSEVPMERRIGIALWTNGERVIKIVSYPSIDEALEAVERGDTDGADQM